MLGEQSIIERKNLVGTAPLASVISSIAPSTVAILAGGKSQRMGRDKAELRFGSHGQQTWLERLCDLAIASGANAVVVGRNRPEGWRNRDVVFLCDALPPCGPLGGLATALAYAGNSRVALVGCDMPRLTTRAFRWLLAQPVGAANPGGVATVAGGELQPLFSIYSPRLLPIIAGQMERGEYSLRGVIGAGRLARVDAPDWLGPQLAGVNTPEEFAAWRGEQS
ncbi:MAG: molybdenum cofactor guanylyltransferase [Chlorobi bacterium CHB2]|nr:molybdenum cofactor guanylyltransferase [Chlorobi bacterium CHB2]